MSDAYVKTDMVVVLPDGTRRWVLAGQPIPADLLDHVPAKDRTKHDDRPTSGAA